jgi:hypothetical protein
VQDTFRRLASLNLKLLIYNDFIENQSLACRLQLPPQVCTTTTAGEAGMNRPTIDRSAIAALPLRQFLVIGMALLLTLAVGLFYHSWQTARLADQVAAQTAVLAKLQSSRATTLVRAAEPLAQVSGKDQKQASPATVDNVVPQDRWVF